MTEYRKTNQVATTDFHFTHAALFHNSSAWQLCALTFQFKLYSRCQPLTFEMNFSSHTGRVGEVKLPFFTLLLVLFVRIVQVVRKAAS